VSDHLLNDLFGLVVLLDGVSVEGAQSFGDVESVKYLLPVICFQAFDALLESVVGIAEWLVGGVV
jgi:hypothetical protein